ncbi:MAG: heme exporter protein CcmB [Hyphomicrobiaceae bacterium]|nr:heme exporter protein CcmB [Hyphomicrobiaceae bacterium]
MSSLWTLLARDLRLAMREGGAVGTALGFYLLVVAMLPLGLGPDLNLLSRIAPGILWIALLLAALLSLSRMFEIDHEDGSLEIMALSGQPLEAVCAVKALAHWLTTGIPLALLAPLLGILLNLDIAAYGVLVATMLAGTPAISFLGSIGAALTLRTRRGGLLIALLVLPLYVPTLIYGIAAISAALMVPTAFWPSFMILLAISLGSLVLGPIAAAAALRIQMQ